jgi:hypothetical protein
LSVCVPRSSATKRPATWRCTPRGDQNRAGLGQRLHPRRDVGHIAIDLAGRIHHRRAGFEADASDKLRLAGTSILAVEVGESALDRQCCPHGALRVVLVRERIAEQGHQPVAELFGDVAAHLHRCRRCVVEISVHQVTPFLGIELRGDSGRTDEIAEHHREVAALAGGFLGPRGCPWRYRYLRWGRRRWRRRGSGRRRFFRSVKLGDCAQNLAAMTERSDTEVFQVLIC